MPETHKKKCDRCGTQGFMAGVTLSRVMFAICSDCFDDLEDWLYPLLNDWVYQGTVVKK